MDKWLSTEQMYFHHQPAIFMQEEAGIIGRVGKPLPNLSASKKEQATANCREPQLGIYPPRDGMLICSLGRRAKAYSAGRLWLAPVWVLQNLEKVGIERY